MNSMMAAASICCSPRWPQARAARSTSKGPQPLSAGINDVVRHPIDERDGAVEPMCDGPVDRLEVGGDQVANLFKCHGKPCRNAPWYLKKPQLGLIGP